MFFQIFKNFGGVSPLRKCLGNVKKLARFLKLLFGNCVEMLSLPDKN